MLREYHVTVSAQGFPHTPKPFADAGIACPHSRRPATDHVPSVIGGRDGALLLLDHQWPTDRAPWIRSSPDVVEREEP
ncbi:MAG: hypothetical protein FD144_4796 [Rhodospirillaceae bacterium]|nr:MAG: hypothetical protein FD144_4796 [Rhodospirillaceae bacterium]